MEEKGAEAEGGKRHSGGEVIPELSVDEGLLAVLQIDVVERGSCSMVAVG